MVRTRARRRRSRVDIAMSLLSIYKLGQEQGRAVAICAKDGNCGIYEKYAAANDKEKYAAANDDEVVDNQTGYLGSARLNSNDLALLHGGRTA